MKKNRGEVCCEQIWISQTELDARSHSGEPFPKLDNFSFFHPHENEIFSLNGRFPNEVPNRAKCRLLLTNCIMSVRDETEVEIGQPQS